MPWRRAALLVLAPFPLGLLLSGLVHLAPSREATGIGPDPDAHEAPPPAALPLRVAPLSQAASPDSSPGTFEGRVLSAATSAPVAGAELTFSRGGAAHTIRAGREGEFLFRPPSAGRWFLAAVAAPGYFPFAPEWGFSPVQLEAAPGRHVRGLEVFLTPAVELSGAVVDEDGAPVPGADVLVLGTGGRATLISIPTRFVTDASGTFRAAAPQGSLLEARKAGFSPGHAAVDLNVVVNGRVRIMLGARWSGADPGRGVLSGHVITGDGYPVPGALVQASRTHGWAYGGAPVAQVVTGSDGSFLFDDLDPSPHQLAVRAEGYAPGRVDRVLPDGRPVVIPLVAGGRVRGCVRDAEDGAAVAPFTVQVYEARNRYGAQEPDHVASVADPSGCFTLTGLRPGSVELIVVAALYSPCHVTGVNVPAPPDEAEVRIALDPGGAITGLVRDERSGAPLANARITAESVAQLNPESFPIPDEGQPIVDPAFPTPTTLAETTTEEDGSYVLRGLSSAVRIHATAAGHHRGTSEVVHVPLAGALGPVAISLRPVLAGDAGPVEPVGIGVVLRSDGDGVAIGALRPGGGAEGSGLLPGDALLEIDDHAVADLGIGGAVEALRGAEGTTVYLQIRRGNAERTVEVVRRRLN